MKTKTVLIINLFLAAAMAAIGVILQPRFPELMATHWGSAGEVNGYGSHFVGIWLMPLMVAGLTLLLVFIPLIDPKRVNIEKFRGSYNLFILLFGFYMLYIHLLTLLWNLGWHFNFTTYMLPAFGIFEIFLGQMVRKAKQNYFIGIRTPWTLQDERVWDETHRQGGIAFTLSGVIALFGILIPALAIWLLLVPVMLASVYSIVLSYVLYQRYNPARNS